MVYVVLTLWALREYLGYRRGVQRAQAAERLRAARESIQRDLSRARSFHRAQELTTEQLAELLAHGEVDRALVG